MPSLRGVFQPLIGQLVWHVRRGHGTFLTMEFGEPHLEVVEPTEANPSASDDVRRRLARRRVYPCGDWHFWIQHCRWIVATRNFKAESETFNEEVLTSTLQELDGQKLVSAGAGQLPHSCVFKFDLGGQIDVRPADDVELDDDQWSLHKWQDRIVSFNCDGELIIEEGASFSPRSGYGRPQHCLNFLPDPQGQGSLRRGFFTGCRAVSPST